MPKFSLDVLNKGVVVTVLGEPRAPYLDYLNHVAAARPVPALTDSRYGFSTLKEALQFIDQQCGYPDAKQPTYADLCTSSRQEKPSPEREPSDAQIQAAIDAKRALAPAKREFAAREADRYKAQAFENAQGVAKYATPSGVAPVREESDEEGKTRIVSDTDYNK